MKGPTEHTQAPRNRLGFLARDIPRLRFRRGALAAWGFCVGLYHSPLTRVAVMMVLLTVQAVLLWLLGQMVDLCLDLMELWLVLARKHLELTL